MKNKKKIKAGISVGDINGIGLEVIIKTFLDNRMFEFCTPIVYCDEKSAVFYRKALGITDFSFNKIKHAEEANPKRLNLLMLEGVEAKVDFGVLAEDAGKLAFASLKKATEDLASNKTDVLITAPINKQNMAWEGKSFSGHTEYLADYANEASPLMVMLYEKLRVGAATGHIPVKEVAGKLSVEGIIDKLEVFNKSLTQDCGIHRPKIAVLGLNPHAGDDGKIGEEEKEIIIPAIEKAFEKGILCTGPFPADGFFGSAMYKKFDGVLALYHDQGLIPFKTLSNNEGVNFTAGLPIVRTSPDHGTAMDIAGQNIASEHSFRNAVFYAIDIYKRRQLYKELIAEKLETSRRK